MQFNAVTHLIAFATLVSQSVGELIITPLYTESKVGDTTYFNCSTDLESEEIFWFHGVKYIYIGKAILEPYNGRFEIDRNASKGSHNLVIHSVEPSDAGEYICVDGEGGGARSSAELIVLDNDPDCKSNMQQDGIIGQNIFNISRDEVRLICNVTYYGNVPPQMVWIKTGDNQSMTGNIESNIAFNNRLIYTLKLEGDISLDKSSYICQSTRSIQNQYNCISEIIKVLYFISGNMTQPNVVRGDEITCAVSIYTFPCISQWYHDNYTCPLSCAETITAHLLGEYRCTVKCTVRGRDYYIEATKAVVVEPPTHSPPSTTVTGTIIVWVVVPIVSVVLTLLIVAVLYSARYHILERVSPLHGYQGWHRYMFVRRTLIDADESVETHYAVEETEELELLHAINKRGNSPREEYITGIAILSDKLFMVRELGSHLEVYDCKNFSLGGKSIKLKGVGNAGDICSCRENNCLYIMKYNPHSYIMKYKTSGILLLKWAVENTRRFSVTAESGVILPIELGHMLVEYLSDGNLRREIILPRNIHPLHAVKRDDHYIVSHGSVYSHQHGVCLVDKEGNVIKSFGRGVGSAKDQMNIPFHFAVASSGCMIVSDLLNNRMILLDSDLEFKAKIIPKYMRRNQSALGVFLDEQRLVLAIVNDDVSEEKPVKEGGTRAEQVGGDTRIESYQLLKKAEELKVQEDSRVLVFDIRPLLHK